MQNKLQTLYFYEKYITSSLSSNYIQIIYLNKDIMGGLLHSDVPV